MSDLIPEAGVAVVREGGVAEIVPGVAGYLCAVCAERDRADPSGLGLCADHLPQIRCEDCRAMLDASPAMLRHISEESPIFHDGCEFGRGFGILRVVFVHGPAFPKPTLAPSAPPEERNP